MADKKPLVLDLGQPEQLQAQDDLDIPLNSRVELLERQLKDLAIYLLQQNIEVPDSITETL